MKRSYRRLLLMLLVILTVFFLLENYIVGQYLESYLGNRESAHLSREIDILDASVLDALIRHDYVSVDHLVSHWSTGHESATSVAVEMANGFPLAVFEREVPEGSRSFEKTKKVMLNGDVLAVIRVKANYSELDRLIKATRLRFFMASGIFLLLLAVALWLAQKRVLLKPLEREIASTREASDHLEALVRERTEELHRELSERRRTEKRLVDREKEMGLLMDSMAEAIYGLDTNGNCTFCNPSCLRMLGYDDPEELLGRNMHEIIHHTNEDGTPNPGEKCRVCLAYKSAEGVHVDDEILWRKDGTSFPVEYWSYPIISDEGVIGAVVTFLDITLRKRAEEEKQGVLDTLNTLVEHMPEGVFLLDSDGTIVMTNPVSEEYIYQIADIGLDRKMKSLAGRRIESLLVSPPQILWHDVEVEGRVFEVGGRILSDGGRVFVVREVTKERELDRQLRMQDRLAAVGQLAAGIAHDFNNILTVINGYAEMTLADPSLDAENRQALDAIFQSGEKAASLIHQILDFSRRTVGEMKVLELNAFVEDFTGFIRRTVPGDIRLDIKLEERELVVRADPAKIQQVMANLIVNARDAMPGGGTLHVRLEYRDYRGTHDVRKDLADGQWAMLAVSDTGQGIADSVLPHIFEPFYTTKEMGKGTGLGLPQVYGLVKQHGGVVTVRSTQGEGSTFEVYLPLGQEQLEEAVGKEAAPLPRGNGQTVLVAEDEESVRRLVANILRSTGYNVLLAENGKEALAVFEGAEQKVRLLVTDIIMPEMGGIALSRELKERDPAIRVIAITGYADGIDDDALDAAGVELLITKPFSVRDLAEAVGQMLSKGNT